MKVGIKMDHIICKNCSVQINDQMDSYYLGCISEFFCSKNCITEYCIREMRIQKVDIENVRQVCDIALFKNGQLYKSNIEDDWCPKCENGNFRFLKMIVENGIEYEVYKCNECGNEIKINCN